MEWEGQLPASLATASEPTKLIPNPPVINGDKRDANWKRDYYGPDLPMVRIEELEKQLQWDNDDEEELQQYDVISTT